MDVKISMGLWKQELVIAGVRVGGGGGEGGRRRVGRRGHAGGLVAAQTQPCFADVHTETDWLAVRSQAGKEHASIHTQETRAVEASGRWGAALCKDVSGLNRCYALFILGSFRGEECCVCL